jgi:hypothetical protein
MYQDIPKTGECMDVAELQEYARTHPHKCPTNVPFTFTLERFDSSTLPYWSQTGCVIGYWDMSSVVLLPSVQLDTWVTPCMYCGQWSLNFNSNMSQLDILGVQCHNNFYPCHEVGPSILSNVSYRVDVSNLLNQKFSGEIEPKV